MQPVTITRYDSTAHDLLRESVCPRGCANNRGTKTRLIRVAGGGWSCPDCGYDATPLKVLTERKPRGMSVRVPYIGGYNSWRSVEMLVRLHKMDGPVIGRYTPECPYPDCKRPMRYTNTVSLRDLYECSERHLVSLEKKFGQLTGWI